MERRNMNIIRKVLIQFGVICLLVAAAANTGYAQIFTDVKSDSKLNEELTVLNNLGGVIQSPNGTFRADDPITRYEVAEFIVRTLQIDLEMSAIPTYLDIPAEDPRMPVIATITELGMMTGYEGKFNPDAKLTRAQAVKILAPAFQLSGQTTIPYSDITKIIVQQLRLKL